MSLTQRNSIELYLTNKYAPPISLGSDTTIAHGFCPFKIKAGSGYTSYLWSTGSTADSIVVNETGDYWVEVVDIFNRTTRDTIHVQYPYEPIPDNSFCLTDTIDANTGLNHAYTFLWSDSSTDSLLNIWEPGEFWVEITDSTPSHCSLRDTFIVVADSFAVKASLGPDLSICSGNTIALTSGLEPGIEYEWSTGDSSTEIPVFTAGLYSLTATNTHGCVAIDTLTVSIAGSKPTVVFNASTSCLGDFTLFTDMSYATAPDGVAAWSWSFGGQGSSSQQNPQFEFSAAGNYNVKLVVTSDSGCVGDTTIGIHVRTLPQAVFTPFNGCSGQSISFGDSSHMAEGAIVAWNWDFGDGANSVVQHPYYTYSDTGKYQVMHSVMDEYGCIDSVINTMNVRVTPQVDFTFTEDCLGQKTMFYESTVVPGWAPIINRFWSFGDGQYSTGKNPSHIYGTSGTYTVSLMNRSVSGCADTISKVVTVFPFPIAGFDYSIACEGLPVCFTDTSISVFDSIVGWDWTFGNNITSTDNNPCIEYADTGEHVVTLSVTSEHGCASLVRDTIIVHPVPQSDFFISPEYGNPPLDVQCYNYTQGAVSQQWFFGDGNGSALLNPTHTYTSEEIFNVALVSENEFGCSDTAYGNVFVIPSILDLVLSNLMASDSGGYINLTARFFNNGTRNIREIALDAKIGNNIPIREEWNGLLMPGETKEYTFVSSFLKPELNDIREVCVDLTTLDSYGQNDAVPADNGSCYSLVDEFYISSVFPNPASNTVYADISVPDDGEVSVYLIDRSGRQLLQKTFNDIEAGMLRVKMDMRFLADGVYILHAAYNDKSDTYRFVKMRE